ncbi:hypothetical protein [Bacillus thuringiensis]|uniref:hypothetical protein n=1 Tax=Bacillus thuringiensis TaxID=1428 RepID=UPI000BFDD1D4|nr:hypothetical protein [Bacillus thuringiensis]PGT89865.1 hypothetical protein COD17_08940 [Bacillus thuringiensis]
MAQGYKLYPRASLIHNWAELLTLTLEEVEGIQQEWEEIKEYNNQLERELRDKRQEERKKAEESMLSLGIEVRKFDKRSIIPKVSGYLPWFKKNVLDAIDKMYPSCGREKPMAYMGSKDVDGITLHNNVSPTNLRELYLRIKSQYDRKKKEANKTDALFIKSIQYATENDINIDNMLPKEIIAVVDDVARQNYVDQIRNEGTVYIKHVCSECDTYEMGAHRCSCGSVRISIEVSGNVLEGFSYDLEGC